MSLPVAIVDNSTDDAAEVRAGALLTTTKATAPTRAEAQAVKAYTALMVDPAGSSDLTIDGSAVPVSFKAAAAAGELVTIDSVRLVFHSTNMKIDGNESRRFGPISAPGLANGLNLTVQQNGTTTEVFLAPVTVLGDFYRYAGGASVGVNSGVVNDVDAISAGVDFLMVLVVLPASVKLYPGTPDNVRVTVSDDLTGIALFEVQVYGTKEPI